MPLAEHLKYIRGPEVSQRTKEQRAKEARDLASTAKNTKSLLDMGFCQSGPAQEKGKNYVLVSEGRESKTWEKRCDWE